MGLAFVVLVIIEALLTHAEGGAIPEVTGAAPELTCAAVGVLV